jgi:hypothetical protein
MPKIVKESKPKRAVADGISWFLVHGLAADGSNQPRTAVVFYDTAAAISRGKFIMQRNKDFYKGVQVQRYEALAAEPVHPAQGLFQWNVPAAVPAAASAIPAAASAIPAAVPAAIPAAASATAMTALLFVGSTWCGLSAVSQDALRRTCRTARAEVPKPKCPIEDLTLFKCCGGFGKFDEYPHTEWWSAKDVSPADLAHRVSLPCIQEWTEKGERFGKHALQFDIDAKSGLMCLDHMPMQGIVDYGSHRQAIPHGTYAAEYLMALARAVFGRSLPVAVEDGIRRSASAALCFDHCIVVFKNQLKRRVVYFD